MRRLPRSATYTFPAASTAMLCGTLNWPGWSPGSPQDFNQFPSLSTFATRELMYPSLMKAFPAASQATSVTCRNKPSTGGSGGFTCFRGPVPSSEASCFRPNTITTRPSGLNLITMSDPLSVAQMLSCASIFTACANDHAYKLCPISRKNSHSHQTPKAARHSPHTPAPSNCPAKKQPRALSNSPPLPPLPPNKHPPAFSRNPARTYTESPAAAAQIQSQPPRPSKAARQQEIVSSDSPRGVTPRIIRASHRACHSFTCAYERSQANVGKWGSK